MITKRDLITTIDTIKTIYAAKLRKLSLSLLAVSCAALYAQLGYTQSATDATDAEDIEEIVVVGNQIKGLDIAGILPVSVLNAEDIEITGAASGLELLKAIPKSAMFPSTNPRLPESTAPAAM